MTSHVEWSEIQHWQSALDITIKPIIYVKQLCGLPKINEVLDVENIQYQMRSNAKYFEYGEHILPRARYLPQNQDDRW